MNSERVARDELPKTRNHVPLRGVRFQVSSEGKQEQTELTEGLFKNFCFLCCLL